MNKTSSISMLKWSLRKEQLISILQREEAQELLKGPITVIPSIMDWGWGASLELKGNDVSIQVPYYQEEVIRSEEEQEKLSDMEHHLSVQTYLLEELLQELKSFMTKHYNVDVSVHK